MGVSITTLDNGMRVISETMPHVRTASVGVWVGAGTRDEPASINGAAHLLEHMAFKGTERRSALSIAEEIEAVGGHLNAYTSREQTAYYARILGNDLPLAVDILADILQHSTLDPEELKREQDVVLQEIGQANDTPDDIIFDFLQEAAYPGQALGRPVLGTEASVKAMRREELHDFMRAHYRAPGMVLVGAGAIEHQALVDLAAERFGVLPRTHNLVPEVARYHGGAWREERDIDQAHVSIAFDAVPHEDPDYYAVQVYATLLGGGMSSRLFQEVREKRGLAYSVFASAASYRDGGLFTVYAGTDPAQVAELVPVIAGEMLDATSKISDEEVRRAAAQLKVGLLMSLESSAARIEQLGRQMLIFGHPLDTEQVIKAVDAVDAWAVKRVARRLLSKPPALAAVGPLSRLESHDRIAARFAA